MPLERTLRMAFDTDMGKEAVISIKHAKENLTEAEVKDAMDVLIARQPLTYELTDKVGAEVVEREVAVLF